MKRWNIIAIVQNRFVTIWLICIFGADMWQTARTEWHREKLPYGNSSLANGKNSLTCALSVVYKQIVTNSSERNPMKSNEIREIQNRSMKWEVMYLNWGNHRRPGLTSYISIHHALFAFANWWFIQTILLPRMVYIKSMTVKHLWSLHHAPHVKSYFSDKSCHHTILSKYC